MTDVECLPSCRKHQIEPGVDLNLRDWGGCGPTTALLIHGIAEGGYVWDDFAPKITGYCKVLAVDLRGHGGSDHDPAGVYTLDKLSDDILRLLRGLAESDFILIGHSLGADVAARIAPALGHSLRALMLVDSGPGGDPETARFLHEQLREGHRPYAGVDDYIQWLKGRRHFAEPATLEHLAKASLIRGSDGLYRLMYDVAVTDMVVADHDDSWWLPSLRQTAAPVLIVRGLASASLSKRTAEELCAATRNGRLAIVPRAGHAVMNDNGEGFAQAVIPFVVRASAVVQTG